MTDFMELNPEQLMALQRNYALLQAAVRFNNDSAFVKNTRLQYVAVSDAFARMAGQENAADMLGKTDLDMMPDRDRARQYIDDDNRVLSGTNIYDQVRQSCNPEDNRHFFSTTKILLTDENGSPLGILGKVRDVTRDVLAREHFAQELQNTMTLTQNDYYAAAIDLNDWKMLVNRFNSSFGRGPSYRMDLDTMLKKAMITLTPDAGAAYAFYSNFSYDYINTIYQSGSSRVLMQYPHRLWDGSMHWMEDEIQLRINPENGHLILELVVHSLEDRRKQELKLRREAETDGLTGVLNRRYAMKKSEQYLENEGADGIHAFFMIDVDNFKQINDALGHRIGDQVLTGLASVLSGCFRGDDIIGRLGGDEFFVLMKHVSSRAAASRKAGEILCKVREVLGPEAPEKPTVSIGICDYPMNGVSVDQLYVNADRALYKAKSLGKNTFAFVTD